MSHETKHNPFPLAPEEEHLAGLSIRGQRRWIEPVVSRGRFLRARIIVGYVLIALFVGLPHLTLNGKPGILLDLAHRQFTFLGVTLHPTDNVLLLVFGAGVVITIFFVTAVFGRIWCGYGCPQTVYLELLFRPIETLIEGRPAVRRKRDAGPWSAGRVLRKGGKWLIYVGIALFLALTFVAYFTGWGQLWSNLAAAGSHGGTVAAVAIVTGLVFLDFAGFREQMCTTACPYGRLQNLLYDEHTLIVGYDAKRGEPRGKPLRKGEERVVGDCVDCARCVRTCPTGIDIRRGLQMECVGCAQCIDACDSVMERLGRPRGLIRYTSERELATGKRHLARPRVFVYGAILLIVYAAFWVLLASRESASVEVLRATREPFQTLPGELVANQLRLRFTNHLDTPQAFSVALLAPEQGDLIVSIMPFVTQGNAVGTVDVVTKVPRNVFEGGRTEARFRVTSDAGLDVTREYVLLGPYR